MFKTFYILPTLVFLPIFSSILLLFLPNKNTNLIRSVGLSTSFLTFFISLFLWVFFDRSYPRFQFIFDFIWISPSNLNFSLGVDGISIFFVLLTTLLIPICLLASWTSITKFYKDIQEDTKFIIFDFGCGTLDITTIDYFL